MNIAPLDDRLVIKDDFYLAYTLIPGWRLDQVRSATAMVVGAGALGNEVLKNLALVGIGRVIIVDFDTIESNNLSRSVLFRMSDEGRRKAEVAAERVKEINPDVGVKWINGDVGLDVGLGLFRRADVVLGCLDSRAARMAVNKLSCRANKPWIDGALGLWSGECRVFAPNGGACYACTLTEADWQAINVRESCPLLARTGLTQGKVPTTPTMASIIGAMQVQRALQLIHGWPVPSGSATVVNLSNSKETDVYEVAFPVDPECQGHFVFEPVELHPDLAAGRSTLRQVLALAKERLGPQACLEFSREMVTSFECPKCNSVCKVFQPRERLTTDDGECPDCGEPRLVHMTHAVSGSEAYLDLTLAEFGVPPLDVIRARSGINTVFMELTRDLEETWRFV